LLLAVEDLGAMAGKELKKEVRSGAQRRCICMAGVVVKIAAPRNLLRVAG
jgi:hypothetical protein